MPPPPAANVTFADQTLLELLVTAGTPDWPVVNVAVSLPRGVLDHTLVSSPEVGSV